MRKTGFMLEAAGIICGVFLVMVLCSCDYWDYEYTFDNQTQYSIQVTVKGQHTIYLSPQKEEKVKLTGPSQDFTWEVSSYQDFEKVYADISGASVVFKER
jgi:hypothetical protein